MSNAFPEKDCPVPATPAVNPDDYDLESCHVPEPPDLPTPEDLTIQGPPGPAGPAGPAGPEGPEGDCDCDLECDETPGIGEEFVFGWMDDKFTCIPIGLCDEEES